MATAAAAPLRERITFRIGERQTVTLDGPGIAQQGRDGSTEYRYMLQEHRIMWVPEDVHRAIIGHGLTFPATFEITKRKAAPWEVVHLVDEPPAYAYRQAPGCGSVNAGSPARPAQPKPAATPAAPRASGPVATAQEQLPAARGTMPGEQPYSASMYTALCAAIRTASAAEKFSQEIGHPVAFDTSDIRTIAATLFIHATRSSQA